MRTLLAAITLLFFATFAQGQITTQGAIGLASGGTFTYEAPIDTVSPCWEEVPAPDASHAYEIAPGYPFQASPFFYGDIPTWPGRTPSLLNQDIPSNYGVTLECGGARLPEGYLQVPSFPEERLRRVKWDGRKLVMLGTNATFSNGVFVLDDSELNAPLDTIVSAPKWSIYSDDPTPTVEMETAVVSELPFPEGGWEEDYLEQRTSTRSARLSYFSTFGEQSAPEYYRVIVPFGDGGAAYIYDWGAGGRGFAPGEHVSVVNYPFNGVVQEAEIWHPGFNKHLVPLPRIISGDLDLTFVRIGDICQYVPTNSIVPTP